MRVNFMFFLVYGMNSNYNALIEIMSGERVQAFLEHHLATYESALFLMLLMKVYIELAPHAPRDRVRAIDKMLRSRMLRSRMHLLLEKWQCRSLNPKLSLDQGAITE